MNNLQKHIWIIDDDPSILEVTQIVLQEAGYTVTCIDNMTMLEDVIKTEAIPSIILLDVLMSGIDGRDVAKKIKTYPTLISVPIIMMSADTKIKEKAEEAGANDYIRKPFNIDDLEIIVSKYLT
jgi:DNA-binding response OmpR family regulator